MVEDILVLKSGRQRRRDLTRAMSQAEGGSDGGSVTLLRPDGTPVSRLAVHGRRSARPVGGGRGWQRQRLDLQLRDAEQPDHATVRRRGPRTARPASRPAIQISPPGGYVGGGLQMQTDLAVSPAGDVWVMNNWQDIDSCFGDPDEALSTRCGGQGVTIFFGMAKPVRAPQIGPARPCAPADSSTAFDSVSSLKHGASNDDSVRRCAGWPRLRGARRC